MKTLTQIIEQMIIDTLHKADKGKVSKKDLIQTLESIYDDFSNINRD